jgi:hypothetical protein
MVGIRKTRTPSFALCGNACGKSDFEEAHAFVHPHVDAAADGFSGVVFIDNS